MITMGRVHLLEEALYSFLQAEGHEESELIIVNDYPHQTLIYDHPNVKIFNSKEIFPTIGDKENFALEQCSGDIFAVWDDDDIAMPWHLTNIKEWFKEDTNLLHWKKGVFYNEPNITDVGWIGNSGIVYSKKAWLDIGKSPIMNAGGDTTLTDTIRALDPKKVVHAEPENPSWFYRWATPESKEGLGNFHQSGEGTDHPGRLNIIERNFNYLENMRLQGKVPTGRIYLKPKWNRDYVKLLNQYRKK